MDIKTYKALAMRTRCPQGDTVIERLQGKSAYARVNHTALLHGCIGLTGEVGEIAEALNKSECDEEPLDTINLIEEIGDCEWYMAEIQDALDTTISDKDLVKVRWSLPVIHQLLSIECGKLMTIMQRWLFYGKGLDTSKVIDSLPQILYCTSGLANLVGVDIYQVRNKNIAKLRKRFPEKYTDFLADEENRDRTAERKILEGEPKAEPESKCTVCGAPCLGMLVVCFKHAVPNGRCHLGNPSASQIAEMIEKERSANQPEVGKIGEVQGTDGTPTDSLWSTPREQTGAGFAELPEEKPENEVNLADWHAFDKRGHLTDSYSRLCRLCQRVAIHKNNSVGVCPDCMAELRKELRKEEAIKP